MPSKIQSVIFDKSKWDIQQSHEWLIQHHIKPIKIAHETKNNWRWRIKLPGKFKNFITKDFGDGIKIVMGFY